MAERTEERESEEREAGASGRDRDPGAAGNRIVFTVVALLVVVMLIAAILGSSSSTTSAVAPGTRALIVPTGDAARTVVVPPCGTGAGAASSPALGTTTAGTVRFELPQGLGTRIVLIPMCSASQGGAAATNALPAAAFVTKPGTGIPPIGPANSLSSSSSQAGAPNTAQFQVTVPNGSPIRTIIIAPCQHTSGPAEELLGTTTSSTTAVAPAC